jgi:K(+)-stimulated pyrophosphate-energized sodium pump
MSLLLALVGVPAFASEADIVLPPLEKVTFNIFGTEVLGVYFMYFGLVVCFVGLVFGLIQYSQIKGLPVHESMAKVSDIIWETCKTYLFQQGKFLSMLWIVIAGCMAYYFGVLTAEPGAEMPVGVKLAWILGSSILGILGSYGVAWFGIRINTQANSRSAFASLKGTNGALEALMVPMKSGMSVGLLLVSVELFFMIVILTFLPPTVIGPCFIGFAIGESLGASALRIAGGIFTKIADIGSDLMKIVFHLPEDDPKNPGVIADCTGDNAGDSVGPTADGFETYGVTGVALVSFLALAMVKNPTECGQLIIWIFTMRILMIITSLVSYLINDVYTKSTLTGKKEFDPESPLTVLVWITSILSIAVTYGATYVLLSGSEKLSGIWFALASIISCGTAAGALIPEFTKIFTSTNSRHVKEVVNAARHGGASLNILSGFVCGNFSAFWQGLLMLVLMAISYKLSFDNKALIALMPANFPVAASIFAFGLVAFGMLGMGPVTIAVDCFGPVSDNAQSVYELSQIESIPNIKSEIKAKFGFEPDFDGSKDALEKNDGAGNTFKATAKPVLIGTAVVGATTMIFGIVMLLDRLFGNVIAHLSLVEPTIIFGLMIGGAVIYWFTGAATQAVVTGAYRAVVYIKENIKLDAATASIKDSKEVVRICTLYAQKGMLNIFIVVFCFALALPFVDPYLFIGYLISIAFFGLYQAIFMANAGGSWDNAKKIVEVDLRMKNTPLHEASVVGDTVGDPFKDTSSVALNPVIKFTTLFGLLAVEIAVTMKDATLKLGIASVLIAIALVFVYRSFYSMRIPEDKDL